MKRRISIEDIGGVKLSLLTDNFFCIHVPAEYDYLLTNPKKTEIVTQLMHCYEAAMDGAKLPVSFSNTFDYKIDEDMYREVQFKLEKEGVTTQIFTKKTEKTKK